jgi:hypothetical protein
MVAIWRSARRERAGKSPQIRHAQSRRRALTPATGDTVGAPVGEADHLHLHRGRRALVLSGPAYPAASTHPISLGLAARYDEMRASYGRKMLGLRARSVRRKLLIVGGGHLP